MEEVIKAATVAAKYPPQAMKDTKRLIREHEVKFLEDVNDKEMILLGQRMASEESANAIVEFMSKFFTLVVVFQKALLSIEYSRSTNTTVTVCDVMNSGQARSQGEGQVVKMICMYYPVLSNTPKNKT